jgi:hypothetical protein
MTTQKLALALVAALLLVGGLVAMPRLVHRTPASSPHRASWTLTPGVLNPAVSQATIHLTICRRGWTRSIRPPSGYTSRLKLEQMRAYRRSGGPMEYQEDHLISLELGGHPTDPRNLWPEPRPRADDVDLIENQLRADVCSGRLTLAEAQRRESTLKHTEG